MLEEDFWEPKISALRCTCIGNSYSSVNLSLLSVFSKIFSGFKSVCVSDYECKNSIALRDYRLISRIWSISNPTNNVSLKIYLPLYLLYLIKS